MKANLVCLNYKTRFSLPKVGEFLYNQEHQYLVWKGRIITDAEELGRSVNEALQALDQMMLYGIGGRIRVVQVEIPDPAEEPASPSETEAESADLPQEEVQQSEEIPVAAAEAEVKRPRGRPPKTLLTTI